MSSLIPNGEQRFVDNNGRPLIGGRVYYYVPNTSTLKDTWQDESMTILNTNPIVLDARGNAPHGVMGHTGKLFEMTKAI